MAAELKKEGQLKNDTVVSTVMSNLGFEHFLQSKGIRLIREQVGDKYVVEKMRKEGFNFGGEQSGHIVFFDYNTTGDGPITALQMLNLLRKKRRKLSELVKKIRLYPQILENVVVKKKRNIDTIPAIRKAVDKVSKDLEGRGRVLVRPSGTEPKIRIMIEGDDTGSIRKYAGYLSKVISKALT